MKAQDKQMITLWDALVEGEETFGYKDIVEVYVCSAKGPKRVQILEKSRQGVLVKMPRLAKGKVYGVKIITSGGWHSFRYLYYQ
jgi:hypothetical protein